ncbi:macro domain-containing protein [Brevundimonas sp.]|jgi:O-acetyl-ADP-ribose deacetylase (regulator of RNase III)|uniref:type II toxin-antitoxin system antitoxin DNA ADP-ribosyl glycohydrolase DarG n=1 Tax=Brevundimonas sp. TaxID=1871086 RepID=UPI0017FF370A|nr:macro domain-containing protein [Brevundimonas sp.]MBA4808871.1 macro domain-containing protein [Brevundimonas sp.]
MITYTSGDILNADVEALVNTVNCVGIMGRGIALQFKNMFPENFEAYAVACAREEVQPGKMFIYPTGALTNPRFIVNFPTKRHWRGKSRIEDIEAGLVALREEILRRGIKSIAIPPLGSGLGGLDWQDVKPRIVSALASLQDVDIRVYDPKGAPEASAMVRRQEAPKMTPGRAALIVLMQRYIGGLMDPFVSLLEVHKLLYFLQESGEGLRLQYRKAHYGPYAENLTHLLRTVEGHFISGYADGGDRPDKLLEIVPGALADAETMLLEAEGTRRRFDTVADLVEGFETPFGLELLATVHWVARHEGAATVDEVVAATYSWNDRKHRFSPEQLALAHDVLSTKGWLDQTA